MKSKDKLIDIAIIRVTIGWLALVYIGIVDMVRDFNETNAQGYGTHTTDTS